MDGIHWGGVAAVAGMYAAFLIVGWLAARKVRHGSASDLMVAGRNLPGLTAVIAITLLVYAGTFVCNWSQLYIITKVGQEILHAMVLLG